MNPPVVQAQSTTPKAITYIVVGSIAFMSLLYMITLSYCVVAKVEAPDGADRSLQAAGMYVLGALTGLLINTRSQSATSTTTTSTSKETEKDA